MISTPWPEPSEEILSRQLRQSSEYVVAVHRSVHDVCSFYPNSLSMAPAAVRNNSSTSHTQYTSGGRYPVVCYKYVLQFFLSFYKTSVLVYVPCCVLQDASSIKLFVEHACVWKRCSHHENNGIYEHSTYCRPKGGSTVSMFLHGGSHQNYNLHGSNGGNEASAERVVNRAHLQYTKVSLSVPVERMGTLLYRLPLLLEYIFSTFSPLLSCCVPFSRFVTQYRGTPCYCLPFALGLMMCYCD